MLLIFLYHFTLLFSWLFALAGFDLPMRFPLGFGLLLRLDRWAADSLLPLINPIIFSVE